MADLDGLRLHALRGFFRLDLCLYGLGLRRLYGRLIHGLLERDRLLGLFLAFGGRIRLDSGLHRSIQRGQLAVRGHSSLLHGLLGDGLNGGRNRYYFLCRQLLHLGTEQENCRVGVRHHVLGTELLLLALLDRGLILNGLVLLLLLGLIGSFLGILAALRVLRLPHQILKAATAGLILLPAGLGQGHIGRHLLHLLEQHVLRNIHGSIHLTLLGCAVRFLFH